LRPLRRGPGQHGEADAALNHATDRVEAVQADAQLQASAGARGVLLEIVLQRAAGGQADQIVIEDVAKRDPAPIAAGRL
jgi:hypothetical protein